jgi:hypothetical protein
VRRARAYKHQYQRQRLAQQPVQLEHVVGVHPIHCPYEQRRGQKVWEPKLSSSSPPASSQTSRHLIHRGDWEGCLRPVVRLFLLRSAVRVHSSTLLYASRCSESLGTKYIHVALEDGCYVDKYSGLRKFNV